MAWCGFGIYHVRLRGGESVAAHYVRGVCKPQGHRLVACVCTVRSPHAREFAFGRFGGAGCRCAYGARFHARGRRAVRVRVCAYGGALFGVAWPQ